MTRVPNTHAGIWLAAVLLLACASGSVSALDLPLTLAQAQELAGRQNPELLALALRADARAQHASAAARATWPRAALGLSWRESNLPSGAFISRLDAGELDEQDLAVRRLNAPAWTSQLATGLTVELPLDVSGRASAATQGARALAAASRAGLQEARAELGLRVHEAYRRAFLARRTAEITERALGGARAREADLDARVSEGAALRADLLRARSRRRQREAELSERRGESAAAAATLARLLGLQPGVSPLADQEPGPAAPLEGDEQAWAARAAAGRALVVVQDNLREAGRWALAAERRGRWPELNVFGQLQDARTRLLGGKQSGTLGVQARLSLFDGARSRREAAAAAEMRAAEQDLRTALDQVRLEVALAYRRSWSARERLQAAAGGSEEGREALRVVRERREAGLATLTDELEAESAALAAELEELRAATDVELADAALARATGAS